MGYVVHIRRGGVARIHLDSCPLYVNRKKDANVDHAWWSLVWPDRKQLHGYLSGLNIKHVWCKKCNSRKEADN